MDNSKSWIYTPRKINVARGIGFGIGDLLGGGWNNIISGVIFTFLMFQGVSPAVAGATTGVGRLVDALFSLFIGGITDNFYRTKLGKRFGRRHFFIIFATILFAVLFPLFWVPVGSAVYYLVIYIAIELVIAFYLIPWETLPTEMTEDYKLRTVLSGSRMVISAVGTSMVFFVLYLLKLSNDPNAYLITGIIWTVIFVAGMIVSWRSTWEHKLDEEFLAKLEAQPKLGASEMLKKNIQSYFNSFRVKAFRKHLAVYLFSFTGKDFFAFMLPTFMIYSLFLTETDAWLLQALAFIGIFSALVASKIMISKGPRFLFTFCYVLIIIVLIGFVGIYIATQWGDIPAPMSLLIVLGLLWHVGRAILEFTPWNVFPFIPDVDYIMTREHNAGQFAAVMTFFRKSTGALATTVGGFALAWVGFTPPPKKMCYVNDVLNEAVKKEDECKALGEGAKFMAPKADYITSYAHSLSDGTLHGITAIFFIGTIGLIAVALVLAQKFRLNRHSHGVLVEEIHRLENGGSKSDVTDEAKKVVEALTGHQYDACWPDAPGHFTSKPIKK